MVSKIEKRFDVIEGFAKELGLTYNGNQAAYANRIKRHLIEEAKEVREMYKDKGTIGAIDTIISRIERLS